MLSRSVTSPQSVAVMQVRKSQPTVATTEMRNEKVTCQKSKHNEETEQARKTAEMVQWVRVLAA